MRTERPVPVRYWQVVVAALLATSCRWVPADGVHDRGPIVYDTATDVSRDYAERRDRGEYPSLVPVLECVEALGHGELRAYFGYENDSRDELHVPIGDQNKFRPWPKDRDQPVYFKSGKHERVLSVTFEDSESVTWALEDGEASADSDAPRCRNDSHSDSNPDDSDHSDDSGKKSCSGSACSPPDGKAKREDAGAPNCPPKPATKPACDRSDGTCASPEGDDMREPSPPAHDAGCGCDDAGAAPSDADLDAAVGDKRCPVSAQFAASCVGALRCGPYPGPLQAKCSRSCCSHTENFTVPLPTIAECIDGRWAFSVDADASTDACSEPHACECSAN